MPLVVGKLVRCEYPPHRGTRVRTPQTAATPNPKANADPTRRPDGVLLLQPWSTALIQTRKSRMAKIARALSHIDNSLPDFQKRFLRGKGRSSQVIVSYGLLARCDCDVSLKAGGWLNKKDLEVLTQLV